MPFEPGMEKRGGRKPGTPNKVNLQLRQRLSDFLEDNFDEVQQEFTKLQGPPKIKAWTELLSFVLPRMSNVNSQIDFSNVSDEDLDRIINHIINAHNAGI